MIKTMMITNNVEIASYAVKCGVNRIFVDLESIGKFERQGRFDTLISNHTIDDVNKIRNHLPEVELLVRLNPFYKDTVNEVNEAIKRGADLLMLPMIRYREEIEAFCKLVDGRAKVVALVETPQAMVRLQDIVSVKGVNEIYIGLNDLHLGLGLDFMFEPIAHGLIDHMVKIIKSVGIPYGIGGLARMDEGKISGKMALSEFLRLGASSVILSRTFHRKAETLEELMKNNKFSIELNRLHEVEKALMKRNKEQITLDAEKAREEIINVSAQIRSGKWNLREKMY